VRRVPYEKLFEMLTILDEDELYFKAFLNSEGRGYDYKYLFHSCNYGEFETMTYDMKMRLFEQGDSKAYKWYFSKDREKGRFDTSEFESYRKLQNSAVMSVCLKQNECEDLDSFSLNDDFYVDEPYNPYDASLESQQCESDDDDCFENPIQSFTKQPIDESIKQKEEVKVFFEEDNIVPRYAGFLIASRETHPFSTEVCLVGGGKRKNFKKRNKRPMKKNRKNKRREPPVFAYEVNHIDLAYTDNTISRNHATFTFLAFRFRLNGLYDPDPALGSGSISGFGEWSNLYRKYLVLKVRIKWDVTNLEAFPITICFCPSNFDINSLITDSSTALDIGEMNGGQVRQLSQAGGMDRNRIDVVVNLSRFWGARGEFLDSSFFSGTGLANPTNLIYGQFAVASSTALVNGINSTLKLIFTVRWYSRQTPFDRTFKEVEIEQEVPNDIIVKNASANDNNDNQMRLQAELAVLKDRIDKMKI